MNTPRKDWDELVRTAREDRAPTVKEGRIIAAFRAQKRSQQAAAASSLLAELAALFGSPRLQLGLGLGGAAALCAALVLGLGGLESLQGESWVALFTGMEGWVS